MTFEIRTVDMKFRMPRSLNDKLRRYSAAYGMPSAEIIRRALRRWNNAAHNRVAVDEFCIPATRDASVPYTVSVELHNVCSEEAGSGDKPSLIPGKIVAAVINWYLQQHPETPSGPAPFHPPEGIRYFVEACDDG